MAIFSAGEGEEYYYNFADLSSLNYPNDTATSIMVPEGYTVTLFQDDGFKGSSKTIQGKMASTGFLECQYMWDFSDKASSAVIVKNAYPYAQGYW